MQAAATTPRVLAVNAGSSSIRFALFEAGDGMRRILDGKVDRVGLSGTSLSSRDWLENRREHVPVDAKGYPDAVEHLLDWLEARRAFSELQAVGHRIVHGMAHSEPETVTSGLIEELRRIIPFDPDHLPAELRLVESVRRRRPALAQAACFDTAFHSGMPAVARCVPIPRAYAAKGVRRYGFHGLSYAFLMEELERQGDPAAVRGRVVLAHLGAGASLSAVLDGRSIDTTMGFTPASGLVMGSRSGDLDPGLSCFLARTENMTASRFQDMVNHESGLLGVSETSSDMRELLVKEPGDPRAAEAVALFCYQARKGIGAFAAALGGIDTLVFAGGIGENAPVIRARIGEGLDFLGITIDPSLNARAAGVISPATSRVAVRVIATDEEQMIARQTLRVLGRPSPP